LYGQVLFIAGGVSVLGATILLLSWFCWIRGSPLSAFYSSTSFKHDMIKKINNPAPASAPGSSSAATSLFSFVTSKDDKLPIPLTTIDNPAAGLSNQQGIISQNNPAVEHSNYTSHNNGTLDQKFINIILSEDNDSEKEKQLSPAVSSSLSKGSSTTQNNGVSDVISNNNLLAKIFDHSQDEKRDDIPVKQAPPSIKKELTFEFVYSANTTASSIPPLPDTPIRSSLKQRKPLFTVPPLPSTPSSFPVSVSNSSTIEQLIAPPLPPALSSSIGGTLYDTVSPGNHIVSAMEFLSPQQQRALLRQQQQQSDELLHGDAHNENDAASVVSSATKSSKSFRFPSPFKKG
jgi:hypothetical protein